MPSRPFREHRHAEEATDKNIDDAVELIKEFLRKELGTSWAEVTADSDENLLNLDLATWGGSRYARREAPWEQMQRENAGIDAYVRAEVCKMCNWHRWA